MVDVAKKNGYKIVFIEKFDFESKRALKDIIYNACNSLLKKIRAFFKIFGDFN